MLCTDQVSLINVAIAVTARDESFGIVAGNNSQVHGNVLIEFDYEKKMPTFLTVIVDV